MANAYWFEYFDDRGNELGHVLVSRREEDWDLYLALFGKTGRIPAGTTEVRIKRNAEIIGIKSKGSL